MTSAMKLVKYPFDYKKEVNGSTALQSLLYDLDLLPEQLKKESDEWYIMMAVICAFRMGRESSNDPS